MAAMKPRTGEGPLEVTKEGRGLVMRVPLEGGGRLVVELSPDEAAALSEALKKRGFVFVGPTTAYALMQATGMVDDHVASCFRATVG